MKSSRILLTAALALGGAAMAGAQSRGYGYGQDPYSRNGPYDNRGGGYYGGGYGGGGYARGGPAAQIGFEDGRRDGERDSSRRKDFRPEKNGNFKDADRGYNGRFGDKRFYKEQYRRAYMDGYRQGYRSVGYNGGYRR
jgi:hypothetical protein